jgi:hypothetical protein
MNISDKLITLRNKLINSCLRKAKNVPLTSFLIFLEDRFDCTRLDPQSKGNLVYCFQTSIFTNVITQRSVSVYNYFLSDAIQQMLLAQFSIVLFSV